MLPSPTTLYRGVYLPTDYSEAGERAFYHALAFAVAGKVPLRLLHVDANGARSDWDRFPGVRETLTRWSGRTELISSADLRDMGLAVRKSLSRGQDPAKIILEGLAHHSGQLLVLAPRVHEGLSGVFHRSLSTELIRKSKALTLFVPEGCRSFVHPETGKIRLSRILFPVSRQPSPQNILELVGDLVDLLDLDAVTGLLLHVGDEEVLARLPDHDRWQWSRCEGEGDPVAVIQKTAEDEAIDLIAMTTEGRQGLGDLVRGSDTERVVKQAPCPVLVRHC